MPATETLRFTAVGHYDVKGVGPCVAKVVAAFIDDASAIAFIKQVNDEQGAEELELFIDGLSATEYQARQAATVALEASHRSGDLHQLLRGALAEKIVVEAWGQVGVIAKLLDLTSTPVVDHDEDIAAICEDYVLRGAAVAVVEGRY